MTNDRSEAQGSIDTVDFNLDFIDFIYARDWTIVISMRTETIGSGGGAENGGNVDHQPLQPASAGAIRLRPSTTILQHSATPARNASRSDAGGPSLRATGFEDDDEDENEVPRETRRKRRFWVLLVMAAIPTLFVVLLTFLMKYYEFPEQVMGVLFLAVVIPAALICEKLGFGEFSIFGPSTIPDWLFYSVMILVVYLYSLVLLASGRGVVWLVGRALLKVRGEKPALSKPLARRMSD